MNRRSLLKTLTAIPLVAATGRLFGKSPWGDSLTAEDANSPSFGADHRSAGPAIYSFAFRNSATGCTASPLSLTTVLPGNTVVDKVSLAGFIGLNRICDLVDVYRQNSAGEFIYEKTLPLLEE
jgi:hypothetical protein